VRGRLNKPNEARKNEFELQQDAGKSKVIDIDISVSSHPYGDDFHCLLILFLPVDIPTSSYSNKHKYTMNLFISQGII